MHHGKTAQSSFMTIKFSSRCARGSSAKTELIIEKMNVTRMFVQMYQAYRLPPLYQVISWVFASGQLPQTSACTQNG